MDNLNFANRSILATDVIYVQDADGQQYKMKWSDVEIFIEANAETFTGTDGLSFTGACTEFIDFDNVGTTSSIALHFKDAFTGKAIETGSYASAASKGITLAAGNTRPVTFLFDDAGAALGAGNYRGVLSRIYLAESQTGQVAIRSIRGQLKVASTKNVNIGANEMNAVNGVEGYIELAGTHTIGANTRVAAVHGFVEVNDNITLTSGGYLCGLLAELGQVTAKTVNGIGTAGIIVDKLDSDHTTHQAVWGTGLLIQDSATTTGIDIGACTTGLTVSSTSTNAISLSGATTNSALNITATDTAGTYGIYMKKTVTGFAGSDYIGAYIRAESATNAATAKSLYGTVIYGTSNAVTHTTGSLWGTLTYAYVKGDAAQTINNIYAGQFEFSMDAGRSNNLTVTTEAAVILAKVTAGKMADDTKLNGMIIRLGDMDGDSATFGNGILIEDDSGMSGTCALTTGINITAPATTGIALSGTVTNGIDLTAATLTQAIDNTLFSIGSYSGAKSVTVTDNYIPFQINLDSIANAAKTIGGAYIKLKHSTAAQGDMQGVPLLVRGTIQQNISSFYGIQNHVTFDTNAVAVGSEVMGFSTQVTGTSAVTGTVYAGYFGLVGDGINGSLGTANVLKIDTRTAAEVRSGLYIETTLGTTMTNVIYFNNAGTNTNLIKFEDASGCVTAVTGAVGNTTHKIAIDIGGATGYLVVYDNVAAS